MNLATKNLFEKAKELPKNFGVYFFKDEKNIIIYVGKAKNLQSRVLSYFKNFDSDFKANSILLHATQIDYKLVKNETQALILEAKLIQTYQPKFNVLLKSGTPFNYIFFSKEKIPKISVTRNTKAKGTYIGPFLSKAQTLKIYTILTDIFGLKICSRKISGGCLYFHLKKCAGFCLENFDLKNYLKKLKLAKQLCLKGPKFFVKKIKKQIKNSNEKLDFETSENLSEILTTLENNFEKLQETKAISHLELEKYIQAHIWIENKTQLFLFSLSQGNVKKEFIYNLNKFESTQSPQEYFNFFYNQAPAPLSIFTNFEIKKILKLENSLVSKINELSPDYIQLALEIVKQDDLKNSSLHLSLKKLFKTKKPIVTIDCFDISHHQGTFQVGSCVRFKNGQPEKDKFRKFKIKLVKQQDDYKCLQEIVFRRYNLTQDFPDLILIDGGKGQLNAVKELYPEVEIASIAKKEERIFRPSFQVEDKNLVHHGIKISEKTIEGSTIISLRDYAHHFAISYHKKLKF